MSGRQQADEKFVEFAKGGSARLQQAAYLLTGNRHQAEEAAQTALVRTYAAWSRVDHDNAYPYARRVLVNLLTERWRRPLREYATEQMPESAGPRGERRFYQRRIDVLGARVLPITAAMRTASVLVERNAFGTAGGFASP